MSFPKRLTDKIAIITGSGRGLGAATALRMAEEGAHIVVNDIAEDAAKQVAGQIEKLGRRALVSTHDVSNTAQANALVDEAKKTFGTIDILVNNAGITRDSMLHKLTEEKWDEVIRVNLKGPFNMGQACAKVMMEKKYGKIVNLASIAWLGNIGQTNYSASKAGVVGLTRTWALELSRYQINVNAIAPGLIDTQMTQAIPAEVKEKFINKIPMRRIGKPEDIAAIVCFLASDEANYVTGQCIQIDGGLTTGGAGG
ncbi:MAG: 3-oxoacyl-ACP reductase FabG [Bdellovibrionales bacterium]|nr:3-oxoacyl-ACP reductase FabG [Bdellovibrionales bacterium]